MLYSKDRDLEDRIVELLVNGNHTVKSIHKIVSPKLPKTVTLRAIYKSVNRLIDENVLLKVGKKVLVNREWISTTRFGLSGGKKLPFLGENEKVMYTLFSMTHIDTYWKTITSQINDKGDDPIFFYNPHDIWIYVPEREESEDSYYRSFERTKRYAFFSIGGTSVSDKKFKQTYQSNYLQIDLLKNSHFNKNDHVTVLGDYIITVTLTDTLAGQIESLYVRSRSEETVADKMHKIAQKPQKIKIVVENYPDKAKRYRKRLVKNFYIPPHVKKRCGLA